MADKASIGVLGCPKCVPMDLLETVNRDNWSPISLFFLSCLICLPSWDAEGITTRVVGGVIHAWGRIQASPFFASCVHLD